MKSRILPAWLVVGVALTIPRLAAQDVTVTDPAWLDPENPPADVLPTFKKRPTLIYPDELKKSLYVTYAIVWETLDENGKRLLSDQAFSNPYIEQLTCMAVANDKIKYAPAKRDGKAIAASCWFGIIFNARSASPKKEDATARILAVAPVIVSNKELPVGTKTPLVIWATLSIDEKGQLQNYAFDEPAYEMLRLQVGGALRLWRFAPARRGEQPVAAELKVPLIFIQDSSPKPSVTGSGTPPKVIFREQPVYPVAMRAFLMRGEVTLEFVIDKTGAVKDVVVKATNNPGFNEAAIEALLKWKFEPGRQNGEPVSTQIQQTIFLENAGAGQDYASVKPASKKAQESLPEDLRYDIQPKPKALVSPVYPYALLKEKKSGNVKVSFLVTPNGKVSAIKVLEASSPEFGLALTAALETYDFIPAMKDGKPTASILKMEREFSLHEDIVSGQDKDLLDLEKNHPEKIVSGKKLDRPLKPTFQHAAVFPTSVVSGVDQGKATIEILIDEEGKVRLPRIVEATDPAFGYAAVQAVAEWRFEPPKSGGKPAIVCVRVPFSFHQQIAADGK
jgi:TonB family protein